MKVLHITTAETWRGGEQQLLWLLGELRNHGVGLALFAPEGSVIARRAQGEGHQVLTFRRRGGLDPVASRQLRRLVGEGAYDLMHTHDSHAHSLAVLSSSLFGNPLPLVVSRRVDFPLSRGIIGRWKYHHPKVKAYIPVSGAIREMLLEGGIPPGYIHLVHSGIDLDRFEGKGDGRLRREFGIPEEIPIIGNVSAIAPHKDYPTFVRTTEEFLRDGGIGRFLIIGGDGGEEELIRRMIGERGLEKDIFLTGFRTDIPDILPELDLFLITSRTEGLGTTILDALAAGVPVVATRAGGIPELIRHEETGLLAEPGESRELAKQIGKLLDDPDLRKQVVETGRAFVQNFSRQRVGEKTLEVYRAVLGDRSEGSHSAILPNRGM